MSQEQHTFLEQPAKGEYALEGTDPGKCKSCGAAIAWAKTQHGGAIPLDLAHVRVYAGQRYATTHFAYCPHGAHWRAKK